MRVQVYKNLRRGDWSIRLNGKVIGHEPALLLTDVTFVVRETRRQAVIAKQCREVHAWAEGELVNTLPEQYVSVPITYNPYRSGAFTRRDNGEAIEHADYVQFTANEGAVALRRVE